MVHVYSSNVYHGTMVHVYVHVYLPGIDIAIDSNRFY